MSTHEHRDPDIVTRRRMGLSAVELKDIRMRMGLTLTAFGRAIGYEGDDNSVSTTVRRYESGERSIPPWIARLALMYDRHGFPEEWWG